jgi:putative aldouronate transport system permease protein
MPAEMIGNISAETVSFAAIIISVIPILVVYPLIFKMLTKGVVIGSLKG